MLIFRGMHTIFFFFCIFAMLLHANYLLCCYSKKSKVPLLLPDRENTLLAGDRRPANIKVESIWAICSYAYSYVHICISLYILRLCRKKSTFSKTTTTSVVHSGHFLCVTDYNSHWAFAELDPDTDQSSPNSTTRWAGG